MFSPRLRSREIVTTVTGGFLAFAVIFGVFLTALPNHLEADFGLSARGRGLMLGLPAITSSIVAFNMSRIRRHVSTGGFLAVASVVWTGSFILIGLSPTLSLVVVGSLVYGLGEGALIPSLQDAAITRAPDRHRGAVMATWTACARLGQTTGPMLAAAIMA